MLCNSNVKFNTDTVSRKLIRIRPLQYVFITLTGTLARCEVQTVFEDIALDTAICRSPPIFSFT